MFDSADNRAAQRLRTLKGARIVFNAGRSTIDCTVKNLSSTGAKLQVTSVVGVPSTFDLILGEGPPRPSRVVWRSLRELGIEFTRLPA